ncbi:MAG: HEAT repeat domain-containing protein [Armatimonadetes bacterium]|nr:HEAT repeat domain-containing protein [Armatimonadota bacterium]
MREISPAGASQVVLAGPGDVASLESLARAARQVSLYGQDHPMAAMALEHVCHAISAEARGEKLEIRAQEKGLVWNGEELALREGNAGRFHAAMRERLMARIEIDPRVQPDEMARLLSLLAAELPDAVARAAAFAEFEAHGEGSVRVEEVDFRTDVLASEAAWRELRKAMDAEETGALGQLVAFCLRSLQGLGDEAALERVRSRVPAAQHEEREGRASDEVAGRAIARIVQDAGEAIYTASKDRWEVWREEVARRVGELSAGTRSRVFRSPCPVSRGLPDMLGLIAQTLNPRHCVSAVLDHPDSIRSERSEGLGLALTRVMSGPGRRREIEKLLHDQALGMGVSEAVYQNVVGMLLSKMTQRNGLGSSAEAEAEDAEKAEPVRVEVAKGLEDLLATTEEEPMRRSRVAMLVDSLAAELTVRQFGIVLSALVDAAQECAEQREVRSLTAILGVMRMAVREEGGQDAGRRAMATSALARSGSEKVIGCLVKGAEGASAALQSELVAVLGSLGQGGVQGLVGIVQGGSGAGVDAALCAILAADDRGATNLRRVISQGDTEMLDRLVRLLTAAGNDRAVEQLSAVIDQVEAVRQLELIGVIRARGDRKLGEAVMHAAAEGRGMVRHAAVETLGALRVRAAVPALCELAVRERNFGMRARVKEAAVRALGEIGDARAVSALCRVLCGRVLALFGSAAPRVIAARVLGEMDGPDARDALRRGCKCLRRPVRAACRTALARLEALHGSGARRVRDAG